VQREQHPQPPTGAVAIGRNSYSQLEDDSLRAAQKSPKSPPRLRDDCRNGLAVIDLQALAAGHLEPVRVEAQLVQDRGMDVGHIVTLLDGVKTNLVGGAVDDTAADAAARQPGTEALRMVVAAIPLGAP
jgi:hypothetical protein